MTLVIVVSRPHCSYCDRKIKQAESSIHIATTTNEAAGLGQKSAKAHKKTYYRLLGHLLPSAAVSFTIIRVNSQLVRRSMSSARSLGPYLAKSDPFAVKICLSNAPPSLASPGYPRRVKRSSARRNGFTVSSRSNHGRSIYFKDTRDFEAFVANLAHGARWKFLTILAVIAITGSADPLLSESARPLLWWICFGIKCVLWTAILSCFVYVSWWLWPRRVFAAPADLPAIRRDFTMIGRIMLFLLLIAFVMGVVMTQIR